MDNMKPIIAQLGNYGRCAAVDRRGIGAPGHSDDRKGNAVGDNFTFKIIFPNINVIARFADIFGLKGNNGQGNA